jgi:hypothetical protein
VSDVSFEPFNRVQKPPLITSKTVSAAPCLGKERTLSVVAGPRPPSANAPETIAGQGTPTARGQSDFIIPS